MSETRVYGRRRNFPVGNVHKSQSSFPMTAHSGGVATWRADFFDNWYDTSPSRSAMISADSEDEAVDEAVAQMGDAARVGFTRMFSHQ